VIIYDKVCSSLDRGGGTAAKSGMEVCQQLRNPHPAAAAPWCSGLGGQAGWWRPACSDLHRGAACICSLVLVFFGLLGSTSEECVPGCLCVVAVEPR